MTPPTGQAPALIPESAGQFQTDPLGFLVRQHQRHGDVFAVPLNGVPTVVFGGTSGPPHLFRAEREHVVVHNTPVVHDLFGKTIFTLRGEEHRKARRLLRSGLTGTSLDAYTTHAVSLTREHVRRWATAEIDLHRATRTLTADVCARIILGLQDGTAEYQSFPRDLDTFAAVGAVRSSRRHTSPMYWRGRRAAHRLRSTTATLIDANKPTMPATVLSELIKKGESSRVGLDGLPEHLLALLIATRETTASLITWLLAELALHPEDAEAIRCESAAVLHDPTVLTRCEGLPLLRAVLTEAERLHSPNAISFRRVITALPIGRHVVPAGWHAAYSPAANHLLPDLFTDPLRFDPERFHSTGGLSKAATLLTFGSGLHACPGKHLAEVLSLATTAAVFADHHLRLPHGLPAGRRYFPVKAPTAPLPAVLTTRTR